MSRKAPTRSEVLAQTDALWLVRLAERGDDGEFGAAVLSVVADPCRGARLVASLVGLLRSGLGSAEDRDAIRSLLTVPLEIGVPTHG